MRRFLFPALGLVEMTATVMLALRDFSLPVQEEIRRGFDGARWVTLGLERDLPAG